MWIKIYSVAIAAFAIGYGWRWDAMFVLLPAYAIFYRLDLKAGAFKHDAETVREKIRALKKHFATNKTKNH